MLPIGWRDAPWWNRVQIENIDAILDTVKRTYNVDENRVVLSRRIGRRHRPLLLRDARHDAVCAASCR